MDLEYIVSKVKQNIPDANLIFEGVPKDKMDVTNLLKFTKENHQSFFINTLYLVTSALNQIELMKPLKL